MLKLYSKELNDKELLDIFPEAREIIPQKIREYQEERLKLINQIGKWRNFVKKIAHSKKKDCFFIWFWGHAYPKYFCTKRIMELDRLLYKLNHQKRILNGNITDTNKIDWENLKELAKQKSLIGEALPQLEKARLCGNRISALCPFHKEKTPSFFIYVNQNSFHCYGCQAHGDVITFKMKIDNISFKEAVKELAA